jgi:hypothetical protein
MGQTCPARYAASMSARLAEHVLTVLRDSFGLSIGVIRYQPVGEDEVWRIDATDAKGERWAASDPDYYRAVCMLAELVGCDLEG